MAILRIFTYLCTKIIHNKVMKARNILSKDARLKLGLKDGDRLDMKGFVAGIKRVPQEKFDFCLKLGYLPLM